MLMLQVSVQLGALYTMWHCWSVWQYHVCTTNIQGDHSDTYQRIRHPWLNAAVYIVCEFVLQSKFKVL
jgi:hypothetical protein